LDCVHVSRLVQVELVLIKGGLQDRYSLQRGWGMRKHSLRGRRLLHQLSS
jgi:hypothetical protein